MSPERSVVYDCNILLQALAAPIGPAGRCVQLALDGEVRLFLCREIVEELRDVAVRPRVAGKLKITADRLDKFVEALEIAATIIEGFPRPFVYERDQDDAIYVNLALAANATLIVSRDKDLLDLMNTQSTAGRDFQSRFPSLHILEPVKFLETLKPTPGTMP